MELSFMAAPTGGTPVPRPYAILRYRYPPVNFSPFIHGQLRESSKNLK